MLIVPKSLVSAYALDTKALEWESKELSQICEQSFTQRSKSMRVKYWSNVWKKKKSTLPQSGRILKPFHVNSFLERWTSFTAAFPVLHSVQQEREKGQKILATSGPSSKKQLSLFNQEPASLKTSKGLSAQRPLTTCRSSKSIAKGLLSVWEKNGVVTSEDLCKSTSGFLFSNMSSADWKRWVIAQRQEYLVRLKSALRTRESGCISWPTVTVQDSKNNGGESQAKRNSVPLNTLVGLQDQDSNNSRGKSQERYKNWQTPEARNQKGYHVQKNGSKTLKLGSQVVKEGKRPNWFTPKIPSCGGKAVRTTPGGWLLKLDDQTDPMGRSGKLNADWTEQLMGLPVGWTQIKKRLIYEDKEKMYSLRKGAVGSTMFDKKKKLLQRGVQKGWCSKETYKTRKNILQFLRERAQRKRPITDEVLQQGMYEKSIPYREPIKRNSKGLVQQKQKICNLRNLRIKGKCTDASSRHIELSSKIPISLQKVSHPITHKTRHVGNNENRLDRLRMLGNGVVPQTAEKAFRTLIRRIYNEL